jgi:uncharacterized membrane protein YcaP (DUF421 family)
MMDLTEIFGHGEQLLPYQMAARAVVIFFLTLVLIRIAGMRTFGEKSAFDNVVVIMLGAVMARGIVGASPLWSTVAGGAALVLVHKLLGWLAMRSSITGKIVKGVRLCLYRDGHTIEKNLRRTSISEDDLREAIRRSLQEDDFSHVKEIYMEKNGCISIVKCA